MVSQVDPGDRGRKKSKKKGMEFIGVRAKRARRYLVMFMEVRDILVCRIVTYSSEPNTKVYGIRPHLFKHFFSLGMSRAADSTKDAQIRGIHSVFSHVRP